MREWWDRSYGLGRSLGMYYGDPRQGGRRRRFYAQFVGAGSLCFDIGAHVGNRSRCWSALGARVVALEPQADLHRFMRLLFALDRNVILLREAVAARPGTVVLHVSSRTPTVTTGSLEFMAEASAVASFAWVRWGATVEVPATTLDLLSARFGRPDFVKIDVEGMEHEVLRGASFAPACLSFEFVSASPSSALRSLDRLQALGRYRFNVALGEGLRLLHERWLEVDEMRGWLEAQPPDGSSGDVYARLE